MNKGFTLFTALISFILIVLAMLLVNSMTNTASSTSDIVSAIEEQTQMQAIADLSRADALQTFNYGLRYHLEKYFLGPENRHTMKEENWEEIKSEFARSFFADPEKDSYPFVGSMTASIVNLLENPPPIRGYEITIVNKERTDRLEEALKTAVSRSVLASDFKFFEVVGDEACKDGDFDNCVGTFYVNIDFSGLSDADYEALPQIRVRNLATGRVVREPILPRTVYRLYMPLRFFKAMAYARDLKKNSADLREQMAGYSLGLCGIGQCIPKADVTVALQPKAIDGQGYEGKLCPGDNRQALGNNAVRLPNRQTYDPSSRSSMEKKFKERVEEIYCQEKASELINWDLGGEEFELLGEACPGILPYGNKLMDVDLLYTTSLPSAHVIPDKGNEYDLSCTKATDFIVTLAFQEKKRDYKVSEKNYTDPDNPQPAFKIDVKDAFDPKPLTRWNCYSDLETIGLEFKGSCHK